MMATRPSFFDDAPSVDLSDFTPKTKPEQPRVPPETVRRVAHEGGFPSRSPVAAPSAPAEPWRWRTGRDTQFNTKVKLETKRGFQELAAELQRPLGEILELALAALQRERSSDH